MFLIGGCFSTPLGTHHDPFHGTRILLLPMPLGIECTQPTMAPVQDKLDLHLMSRAQPARRLNQVLGLARPQRSRLDESPMW